MKETKKMENTPTFDNSFVDKTLPTTSISTILGMVQEPFDQKGVAQKTFEKRFNDPESEYYRMTVEQIIEKWQQKGQISVFRQSMHQHQEAQRSQDRQGCL